MCSANLNEEDHSEETKRITDVKSIKSMADEFQVSQNKQ
jgi:hypothetical protein